MHSDLSNHDCLVDYMERNNNKIVINHVAYSWFSDIYSTSGIRVFEIRNNKYIQEDSDLFA